MNPKVSIIIPCFNSESTLEETLQSVLRQNYKNWEAIIVNDGSTDGTEDISLKWLKSDDRFRYYSKPNEGLGKTRNFGIEKALGQYILPLDSDNLVVQNFIEEAVEILEKKPEIGVIHGHAECFGHKEKFWQVDDFDFKKLLLRNYIDACAVYRKPLWQLAGGYDEKMPFQGFEDWDLWLRFGTLNVKFHHLEKVTFKYRLSETSMISSYTPDHYKQNIKYISKKYGQFYKDHYEKYYNRAMHHQTNPLRAIGFYFKLFMFKKLTKLGIGKKFIAKI